ncbi:MAG: polyhydroxyalkanoate depolymerase, partial [Planctomycetes bacterium]|nr:polyhydroxyalkanoate depolymerase [Planctomycetota bacterium]
WHFTGAAEPTGNELDRAWFVGRAATAQRDHPLHAIFAVSYKRTPQTFPFPWDRTIDYVHAVNVTDRYTRRAVKLPEGVGRVMFRVLRSRGGDRAAARLKITDKAGKVLFEGTTKDERFDANDHLTVPLRLGELYKLEIRHGDKTINETVKPAKDDQLFSFRLAAAAAAPPADKAPASKVIQSLKDYLQLAADKRPPLDKQAFAGAALSKADAAAAEALLWKDHAARIRKERAAEMKARKITVGKLEMPFYYKIFGEKPEGGRSLFISMHGGGGAPKRVNDQQWENQKRLYSPAEGVYLVPRAATNTWNLWHQGHIDGMFDRLIENLIVFEDVDPDRVYLLGYSAGGDGVYQLAPRMADRFGAASMMAGHPNETVPLGLRNLAFSLHVGERDGAYSRNKVAQKWKDQLAELHKADPGGYEHWAKIYPGKGHWLNREDAAALPWMAKYRRKLLPERIVWKQDDVTHYRFYWLAVDDKNCRARSEVIATLNGQTIDVSSKDIERLTVRLSDAMLDLDRPITITSGGKTLFSGPVKRTTGVLAKTLAERGDPKGIFHAEVTVDLPSEE